MRHVAGRLSFPELYQTNEAFELLNKGAHLLSASSTISAKVTLERRRRKGETLPPRVTALSAVPW